MATGDAFDSGNGSAGLKSPRVLIVEDEVLVAMDIAEHLERAGFEVVGPCVRLADAREMAASAPIDAAMLDGNLGNGTTSAEVAELLRARGIPFAFVSAYAPEEIDGWQAGEPALRKPVTSGEMIRELGRMI